MKIHLTKAFFASASAIIFLFSLSSCGKDCDLVSDYVVRNNTSKTITHNMLNNNTLPDNNFNTTTKNNIDPTEHK
ncbi:hypothetical protein SAMN05421797_1011315 [Maribacter ulvicola]|uniref:Lipoprotein n=1 Tax=Maribacter ulvicola TaxID=228959 RepID=A0A1N6RKC9_9FLAO|nr:hypothetical protein SAMN05421797_1011315 [Maribacter ulvicola]